MDRLGSGTAFQKGAPRLACHSYDAGECALERDDRLGASASLGGGRGDAKLPQYRSQEWQDGAKAEDMLTKLEHLQETMDHLQGGD